MIVDEDKDEIVIIVLNQPANFSRDIPVDLIIATGLAIGGGGGGGSIELG